jgi:hypothetical protein
MNRSIGLKKIKIRLLGTRIAYLELLKIMIIIKV